MFNNSCVVALLRQRSLLCSWLARQGFMNWCQMLLHALLMPCIHGLCALHARRVMQSCASTLLAPTWLFCSCRAMLLLLLQRVVVHMWLY
jgi:hypothetical protein